MFLGRVRSLHRSALHLTVKRAAVFTRRAARGDVAPSIPTFRFGGTSMCLSRSFDLSSKTYLRFNNTLGTRGITSSGRSKTSRSTASETTSKQAALQGTRNAQKDDSEDSTSGDDDDDMVSEASAVEDYWQREPVMLLKEPLKEAKKNQSFSGRMWSGTKKFAARGTKVTWAYIKEPSRFPKLASRCWVVVKKEASHYYHGFRLLLADVRFAFRLMRKILRGRSLTRRERRQLVRTSADVFRLVPFAMFIVIPFMEFLLPFALKLFPNMLPSTFQTDKQTAENLKRELQGRLNVAVFLQDTVEAMALQHMNKDGDRQQAQDLVNLVEKVRGGERVSNEELLGVAKLFKDEMTLDNIDRGQLVQLCKFMGLSPFGLEFYLRERLYKKLTAIKHDDELIAKEGVDSLDRSELKAALRDRGMRTVGLTMRGYRRNLNQWLDLSLNHHVPALLLIMSRAFNISERHPMEIQNIKKALLSLDDELVDEVLVDSGATDEKHRLELLRLQQDYIKEDEEDLAGERVLPQSVQSVQEEEQERMEKFADSVTSMASTSALDDERKILQDLKRKAEEEDVFEETEKRTLQLVEDDLIDRTERFEKLDESVQATPKKKRKKDEEEDSEALESEETKRQQVEALLAAKSEELDAKYEKEDQQERDYQRKADRERVSAQQSKDKKAKKVPSLADTAHNLEALEAERVAEMQELRAKARQKEELTEIVRQEIELSKQREEAERLASEGTKGLEADDAASCAERLEEQTENRRRELSETKEAFDKMKDILVVREKLSNRVDSMILELERAVDDVDSKITKSLNILDADGDGYVSAEELEEAIKTLKVFKSDRDAQTAFQALMEKAKVLQSRPLPLSAIRALAEDFKEDYDVNTELEELRRKEKQEELDKALKEGPLN